MSKSSVIRALILFENVLGVYRNCALLNRRLRSVAKCRVVIETCVFTLYFVYCVKICLDYFSTRSGLTFNILHLYYTLFVTFNSLTSIFSGYYFSNRYKDLVISIDAIHKICEDDVIYKRIVAKRNRRYSIDLAMLAAAVIGSQFLHFRNNVGMIREKNFVVQSLAQAILQCRYHTESVVFYELSELISSRLEYLNASILETCENLNQGECRASGDLGEVRQELDRWEEIRRLLGSASDCLRDCFGNQITLALYSSMPIYIGLFYVVIIFLATKESAMFTAWSFTFRLGLYLAIKVLILTAGQRVQDQAGLLDTNLARLHCLLLTIPGAVAVECARVLRALSRRMRAAPVRVRLQTALPVRAALLVDIVAFVVYYTILLLQFNHVL